MTVDREQILRDAEWLAQIQTGVAADRARLLGADLLALLTELEQAEKKHAQVSEWYNAEDRKTRELQARLAKVPALVDDLRLIASGNWDDDSGLAREIRAFASAALKAWEQE